MNTGSRGWRWLAALAVSMLVASVLSLAGGGAVQAANTASEEQKDTNNDNVPDSRLFAGSHRYETAELLARRFASDNGGVSSVVIASGERDGVDALTAAGLAGSMNAPVLLTRSARLPFNVARFINDMNVTNVTVVGGTAAVSDAVITQIRALGSRPTVKRVSGDDRYATAAMIGGELGGASATWCGTNLRSAILVNGQDAGKADAIVAGPLANRLGLPMLLTEADALPAATRQYLVDKRIERVTVIGDATTVSAAVINTMLEEVGVANAPRISGATAAATSVAVAKEMLGDACASEISVDRDRVALINRTATADGLAASPVLGRGLGNTGAIPILLVDSALPAEVREFLAGTMNVRNGKKTNLSIVAVGGAAVVSDAVMTAAVEAATTSADLTAKIAYNPDPAWPPSLRQFTVTFSDAVKTGAVSPTNPLTVLNPAMYRINGRRLSAATPNNNLNNPDEGVRTSEAFILAGNTVTVTLGRNNDDKFAQLKAGDKIDVIGGAQVGANEDKRKLKSASLTIGRTAAATPAADTTAPRVEVVAVANQNRFTVFVHEPNLLKNAAGAVTIPRDKFGQLKVYQGGVTTAAYLGPFVGQPFTGVRSYTPPGNGNIYNIDSAQGSVNRPGPDGYATGVIKYDISLDTNVVLKPGDVINIPRGTWTDTGGRPNPLTRVTVQAPKSRFTVSNISVGNKYQITPASGVIKLGATTGMQDDLRVTAKGDGIAAGTAGNGWRIFGYQLPTASNTKPVEIDVNVDERNKIISYTVRNGLPQAKIIDLARALGADAKFNANFHLTFADPTVAQRNPQASIGSIDSAAVSLTGGISAVAVRVDFNDPVDLMTLNVGNALRGAADIAHDVLGRDRPYGANSPVRISIMYSRDDPFLSLSYESSEQPFGTNNQSTALPKRGDTVIIRGTALVDGFHATSGCGPIAATCPSGQTANNNDSDNLQTAFFRSLRLDASLKPFNSSVTCATQRVVGCTR